MSLLLVGLLCGLSLFYGWRYSKASADPDWAFFNLWGFTGAVYGKDFVDCKTPGVHLWFLFLSKLVGKDVGRVRFANHFLVGMAGIPVYLLTGNVWAGVAFIVLVNSGWLLAFHGNVGQVPAALLVIALVSPAWVSVLLWLVSVFYEPKLLPPFVVFVAIQGWWWLVVLVPVGGVAYLLFRNQQWFRWLWESSVTLPGRMTGFNKASKEFVVWTMPWFTANGLISFLPWLGAGVVNRLDILYWLPVLAYLGFLMFGQTIRPNHLIPAVPWIALSLSPAFALVLGLADLLSAGFYFGNIWNRFYPALNPSNEYAKLVGEWLRDKEGNLWINGLHSAAYLYSGKKPTLGIVEQLGLREVAYERRNEMIKRWGQRPPDWVVQGEYGYINFQPLGYEMRTQIGPNIIYERVVG